MATRRYGIRLGRGADAPLLQHIEQEAASRLTQAGLAELVAPPALSDELISMFLERGVIFVATHERQPVAFAAGCLLDGAGHVAELDVLTTHAGRRLGSRLIDRVARWAAQRGARQLTLTTYRDVPWNAPYYERLGFHVTSVEALGRAHVEVWEGQRGMGLDMARRVVMARPIAPAAKGR